MSNYNRCPICDAILKHLRNDQYTCNKYYNKDKPMGHYYQTDFKSSELIRDFKIGFDIWHNKYNYEFSINIGSDPFYDIIDNKLTIMDVYNKIYKMKAFL